MYDDNNGGGGIKRIRGDIMGKRVVSSLHGLLPFCFSPLNIYLYTTIIHFIFHLSLIASSPLKVLNSFNKLPSTNTTAII